MIAIVVLGVFMTAVVLDYADSANTRAVTDGRAHAAARWSIVMYGCGLLGLYVLTQVSWWLAIPEVLGLYAGSWIAVSRAARST